MEKRQKAKKNWVKGFDRIALVSAIPMAIFGTYYCPKKYAESKAVWVIVTDDAKAAARAIKRGKDIARGIDPSKYDIFDDLAARRVFDYPQENGVIADGLEELRQQGDKSSIAKQILDKVLQYKGADPNGTLVCNGKFGLDSPQDLVFKDEISLIPSKSKRYLIGAAGALGFFATTILGIGLLTRCIPRLCRWLKDGFKEGQ